jgi:hypothetical protein
MQPQPGFVRRRILVLGTPVWAHSWAHWASFSLRLLRNRHENAITVIAQQDGSFTVTNTRDGFSKTYRPRP